MRNKKKNKRILYDLIQFFFIQGERMNELICIKKARLVEKLQLV